MSHSPVVSHFEQVTQDSTWKLNNSSNHSNPRHLEGEVCSSEPQSAENKLPTVVIIDNICCFSLESLGFWTVGWTIEAKRRRLFGLCKIIMGFFCIFLTFYVLNDSAAALVLVLFFRLFEWMLHTSPDQLYKTVHPFLALSHFKLGSSRQTILFNILWKLDHHL